MKTKLFKWLFFILQLGLAIYFGLGQSIRITYSTQGLSLIMFLGFLVSFLINLILALRSRDINGNKDWFIVSIYSVWVLVGINIIVFMFCNNIFKTLDLKFEALMLFGIIFGLIILFFVKKTYKWDFSHSYMRGAISAIFKSFPQLILIPIAYHNGVSGWDPGTIWVGLSTMLIRVILLITSILKYGKNKENVALLYSEIFNVLSWLAFMLVYYTLV